LESRLWLLPNHLRPSQSIKGLKRGRLEKPHSFRDRIYLTDVGEAVWGTARGTGPGATIRLAAHRSYLMTRLEVFATGLGIILEGHKVGRSSWTAAFLLTVTGEPAAVARYLGGVLGRLGRPPYTSPYWGEQEWRAMAGAHEIDQDGMSRGWETALPGRMGAAGGQMVAAP
jgi:hypothetical protein